MEKRLHSSLQNSAEEFLKSATKSNLKSVKSSLNTLISRINQSSELSTSLPISLHQSITRSIDSFKESNNDDDCNRRSPSRSPPVKRTRRSSRKKGGGAKDSTEDEENCSNHPNSRKQDLLQNLQIYAHITYLCVTHPKKLFICEDVLPCVQLLHDNLILFESDPLLLSEVANLCEEWWKEQLPGRETLISQFLPVLLSKSLELQKKGDVKRIYSLREAFTLLDFEDESIEDLKLLLIRCIITPVYLKTDEGRKFIAFLFGLSGQLLKEALAIIKSQIPFGRKSMLEAYAEVLFRAWKVAEGTMRDEIENGFMQGLIEGAVYASSAAFAASIRRVLGGFISQRNVDGVEKLLFRLAEPVLFRSLQAANSNVRQNALHLLLDMFPFDDPDATREVLDSLHEKQYFLLETLLTDECPEVRVVAVEGCCRILHLFWEVIPDSIIKKTLTKVTGDMSHDLCAEVRLSTLSGIIYLLGNPQTHDLLKVFLPRLGHLFQDSVLSVRSSVADLLLVLRDIRDFQFHKVVSLEDLLSSLADDQPLIAQKITRLLIPSYFPSKVVVDEACSRCITLIKRSPMAGARFCEFALSEGSPPKSLLELVKFSITLALSREVNSEQTEGFLLAADNLCQSLVSEGSCKGVLKEFLSGDKLKRLLCRADTELAQTSIFKIATVVSPNATGLLKECMVIINKCEGLSEDLERQEEVRSVHKLMLSCGWFDKLFKALTELLQAAVYWCHTKFGTKTPLQSVTSDKQKSSRLSAKKSSTNSKNVKGKNAASSDDMSTVEEDFVIAAGAAWQIKDMLACSQTREAVVNSPMLELAISALEIISEVSIKQCMSFEYCDTSAVSAYTALVLHASNEIEATGRNDLSRKEGRSPVKMMALEPSLDCLFDCTEHLFSTSNSQNGKDSPAKAKTQKEKTQSRRKHKGEAQTNASTPSETGSSFAEQKKIFNMVKMVTAVLKFIVDATSVGLVAHHQERCLRFTSAYFQFIISTLSKLSEDIEQFKEEEMKETLLCLKSCFTYAAKLLNLALKTATKAQPEVSDLANNMFNLIMSVEFYLGSKNATCFLAAAKPWLSDLILALSSGCILAENFHEWDFSGLADQGMNTFLPWISCFAKIELCQLSDPSESDTENGLEPSKYLVFTKFVENIVLTSSKNPKILDAVGVMFLTGSSVGLQREDYELVFGLVHFVCVKLVKHENREWGELEMMLAFVAKLYPQIEQNMKDPTIYEDGRHMLECARVLLEPVWQSFLFEADGGGSRMDEEEDILHS
ncbi:hypothetical protein MKW94_017568 [Papaver nudicaule]|uniref:Condensin-2 complex subunit G2 n=1 Tax=Papaver nudicaule TaxID=74823 RepID=A0AA41UZ73_PAPNU|nr:hypothetical protein [Papaver nudicaule]